MDVDLQVNTDTEPETHQYDYDLIVIGGGSGGIACAKEAARFGKKVALLDYVKPTPKGTKWGLGGTCVNVGCIPKKLMHTAALQRESIKDAAQYGWTAPENPAHQWDVMVQNIQDHIGSLNWGYRVELRKKGVEYLNELGVFVDPHTIECTNRAGAKRRLTARRFVIAVGGRPTYPNIPGDRELCITSDDLFSLAHPPGETLVIGASYVALECAGFIASLGFKAHVMVRSILLRGFDQQMAEMIGDYMKGHGVNFIRSAIPSRVERNDASGRLRVTYLESPDGTTKLEKTIEVDTVLFAIGRYADTPLLCLDKAGVITNATTGKIPAISEQSNVPHIYAVGDVLLGRPELTPVAILAGKLLARRLYGGSTEQMNYEKIPTTVFTPLEYGAIGLSEEQAIERLGADNVEVYHSYFMPLEWTVAHREENVCYAKLICDRTQNERVIGFHVLAPNAGEVTQGYAVGMRMNATKHDFDMTVGIHPTVAEEFTTLLKTKRSGEDAKKTGC